MNIWSVGHLTCECRRLFLLGGTVFTLLLTGSVLPGQEQENGTDSAVKRMIGELQEKVNDVRSLRLRYRYGSGTPYGWKHRSGRIRFRRNRFYLHRFLGGGGSSGELFLSSLYVSRDRVARRWLLRESGFAQLLTHTFQPDRDGRYGPSALTRRDWSRFAPGMYQFLLMPWRIQKLGTRVGVENHWNASSGSIRIKKNVPLGPSGDAKSQYIFVIKKEPVRLHRVIVVSGQKPNTLTVTFRRRQKKNGVRLPVEMKLRLARTGAEEGTGTSRVISFDVVEMNGADREFETPVWVRDPALPDVTDQSPEKLRKTWKGERNPPADVFTKYVNRLLLKNERVDRARFQQTNVLKHLKRGVRAYPDSRLLKQYRFAALYTKGDLPAVEKDVKSRSDGGGTTSWEAYLLAMLYKEREQGPKARNYFGKTDGDPLLKSSAKRERALIDLKDASSPDTFLRRVQAYRERKKWLKNMMSLLERVEPPFDRSRQHDRGWLMDRDHAFLSSLEKKGSLDAIALLLARVYARNGKPKKASRFYQNVLQHAYLHPEIRFFIREYEMTVEPLVVRMMDRIFMPRMLQKLARKRFEEGRDQRAIQLVERFKKGLLKGTRTDLRSSGYVDEMGPVVEHLLRNDRKPLARELVLAYLRTFQEAGRPEFLDAIKRCFEDRPEQIYRAARLIRSGSRRRLLKNSEAIDVLLGRFRNSNVDRVDLKLVEQIAGEALEETALNRDRVIRVLRKGIQQAPRMENLHRLLGRLLVAEGEEKKAIEAYRRYLNLKPELQGKQIPRVREKDLDQSVRATLQETRTSLERFVILCERHGRDDLARKQIRAVLRRIPDRPLSREHVKMYGLVAFSYGLLGLQNEKRSSLRMLLSRLLKANKRVRNRYFFRVLNWLAVELIRADRIAEALSVVQIGRRSVDEQTLRSLRQLLNRRLKEKHVKRFVREHLVEKPENTDQEQVRTLVKRLGRSSYRDRQKAMKDLKNLGWKAVGVLLQHWQHANPEVRSRVRSLIRGMMGKRYRTVLAREEMPRNGTGRAGKKKE